MFFDCDDEDEDDIETYDDEESEDMPDGNNGPQPRADIIQAKGSIIRPVDSPAEVKLEPSGMTSWEKNYLAQEPWWSKDIFQPSNKVDSYWAGKKYVGPL